MATAEPLRHTLRFSLRCDAGELSLEEMKELVQLRDQATEIGCDQVVYPDATKKGLWWDPFPPGEWR